MGKGQAQLVELGLYAGEDGDLTSVLPIETFIGVVRFFVAVTSIGAGRGLPRLLLIASEVDISNDELELSNE